MRDNLRNAQLSDLAELLRDQHARKHDVVVPADRLRSDQGELVVVGGHADLTDTGVSTSDLRLAVTEVAEEGLAAKLDIPRAYLRRLRERHIELFDQNVNGWLDKDERSFLVRSFTDGISGGVARAFLSDSYRIVDHLDVLTAALEGVRQSGVEVQVGQVDLTDRRMYVKVHAPAVAELAPELLKGYRSPYSGREGGDNPTVFAGFVISNSETGGGRFTITPRLVVEICSNGMTIARDALAKTHLGSKLEQGVIQWSNETLQRNLELVSSQARDAVATFLNPDYLRAKIGQLTEAAGGEATVKTIETVTGQLSYPQDRIDNILDAFVKGGQATLGGVAQAITAAAQREPDADAAALMESQAVDLLVGA